VTDHDLSLEPARDADRPYVETLLSRNGLPTDDIPDRDDASPSIHPVTIRSRFGWTEQVREDFERPHSPQSR